MSEIAGGNIWREKNTECSLDQRMQLCPFPLGLDEFVGANKPKIGLALGLVSVMNRELPIQPSSKIYVFASYSREQIPVQRHTMAGDIFPANRLLSFSFNPIKVAHGSSLCLSTEGKIAAKKYLLVAGLNPQCHYNKHRAHKRKAPPPVC